MTQLKKPLTAKDALNPTILHLFSLPVIDANNPHNLIMRFNEPAQFTKALKTAARLYLLFWVNFHITPEQRTQRLRGVKFCDKTQTAEAYNYNNGLPFTVSIELILKATEAGFLELKHYN